MGTQNDFRSSLPRRDDQTRQKLVQTAIAQVIKEGYAVGSDRVEDLLKEDSMLPVQVSLPLGPFTLRGRF
jgi:hypothetical protein